MTENTLKPRRSFIFTPPFKYDMFKKALLTNVDMVCLELEDGIHPNEKENARNCAIKNIKDNDTSSNAEILIRINSIREELGLKDLLALLNTTYQPDGIMIPKVKTPDEIVIIDNLLKDKQLNTKIHVIIETNDGLKNVFDIASSSRKIETLFFGGVDMSADLGCDNSWENLLYARSRIIHAAASNHLDAIDVPFLDLEDLKSLEKEAINTKKLGFTGKGTIHPKQIDLINNVFTPSKEEILKAKEIVSAFEENKTALLVYKGKLIEKPVLREMYRLLNIEKKIKKNN